MLTELEAEQIRLLGRPEIWTIEGTKILGRLIRESRAKVPHPLRYRKGITTTELSDYIAEIMALFDIPFRVADKTIQAIEFSEPRAIPKHNTIVALTAARFIRHPVTEEVFSLAQLSLIASGIYDPYSEKNERFYGVANPEKTATLLSKFEKENIMTDSSAGIKNLAATLKIARLDLGVSIAEICRRVRELAGIEISPDLLKQIEAGTAGFQAGALMGLVAVEYAINPNTNRPYTMADILNIANERLEPLNPRTSRHFTGLDFEFLEISTGCDSPNHLA